MGDQRLRLRFAILTVVATGAASCAGSVRATPMPATLQQSAFWVAPADVSTRDLFNGPWGARYAPDPNVEYTYVREKITGVNPGVVVRDPQGRQWRVKQPPENRRQGDEGPVEVVLSRVLSAVGYHQPPVYYLPAFKMRDASGVHTERGGRFRLHDPKMMKDVGEWSWQQNPFVGQRPYQGLLVILLMFNSSDLKNSNNTVYDVTTPSGTAEWYVVRDLGNALGETGVMSQRRNNIDTFSRSRWITGVKNGFVEFDYHAMHKELLRQRLTPDDVAWASTLMSRITPRQWEDAFRAGGYPPDTATRFIAILHDRVGEGLSVRGGAATR